MKYLQKSFSVYPSVPKRPFPGFFDRGKGVPIPIDPKHRFTDIGGMCRFCALSKEGHNAKYGRKK